MTHDAPSLPQAFLDEIKSALSEKSWTLDPEEINPHLEDWRGNYRGHSQLLIKPASTEEVAIAVKLCAKHNIPITPQGGNTGLVNAGLAHGEVVLSLKRMNTIRDIDPLNNSITVDAGCILTSVHSAAEDNDRFFPLSLGSQGTATIGGLISTNAGGVAVLRYGMMRDLLLGIEVVTADGEIWGGLRGLRKDNTGYDLKHLLAGAEGTLGIVTGACLKLFPTPRTATAWLALETPEHAVDLLSLFRSKAGDTVTSFELMHKSGVELAAAEITGCRDPLPTEIPWRVLVELSFADEKLAQDTMERVLEKAFESGLIADGTIAASLTHAEEFWKVRESLPLVKRGFLTSVNHDISIPVSRIPEFLRECEARLKSDVGNVDIFAFGHLGDGNLHYAVAEPASAEHPIVKAQAEHITDLVHTLVTSMGGSISAEHGIGLLKRHELPDHKNPAELETMRRIKRALDPQNIMNPGRIFTV